MQELVEILKDLVELRSDVGKDKNESAVTDYIVNFFSKLPQWNLVEQEVSSGRKNLIVSSNDDPRIVFVGHQDTVPVVNDDQLLAVVKNNKLYGRGAVDMKAGLATMLMLAAETKVRDIAFIFTVDEEYEFLGIEKFIKENNWKPKLIINPEPTDLKILNQCRGFTEVKLELEGLSVHAGQKDNGINAIEKSVELSFSLEKMMREYDKSEMTTSINLAALEGGVFEDGNILIRPNIVPDFTRMTLEIRLGSEKLTKNKIKELVVIALEKVGLKLRSYHNDLWYGTMTSSESGIKEFTKVIEKNNIKVDFQNPNESGFYEVQMLQSIWNCGVIIFGVGPHSKSHQIDEYVNLDSLEKSYKVFEDFIN